MHINQYGMATATVNHRPRPSRSRRGGHWTLHHVRAASLVHSPPWRLHLHFADSTFSAVDEFVAIAMLVHQVRVGLLPPPEVVVLDVLKPTALARDACHGHPWPHT